MINFVLNNKEKEELIYRKNFEEFQLTFNDNKIKVKKVFTFFLANISYFILDLGDFEKSSYSQKLLDNSLCFALIDENLYQLDIISFLSLLETLNSEEEDETKQKMIDLISKQIKQQDTEGKKEILKEFLSLIEVIKTYESFLLNQAEEESVGIYVKNLNQIMNTIKSSIEDFSDEIYQKILDSNVDILCLIGFSMIINHK